MLVVLVHISFGYLFMDIAEKDKYNGYLLSVMPLTEVQKRHLICRDSVPVAIKKNNEYAIRQNLKKFLKSLDDMMLVLNYLPERQLRKHLKDRHAYAFLKLASLTMEKLEFSPIEGDIKKPDNWHITTKNKEGTFETRPSNYSDILRSVTLHRLFSRFDQFVSSTDPAYMAYRLAASEAQAPKNAVSLTDLEYHEAMQKVTSVVLLHPAEQQEISAENNLAYGLDAEVAEIRKVVEDYMKDYEGDDLMDASRS
jgi:hypothetical protein